MATRVYVLEVSIIEGPLREAPEHALPPPARTIEIHGDRTLRDLHGAILTAFGRWSDYLEECLFYEERPDCGGIRDGPHWAPAALTDPLDGGQPVSPRVCLDALGLKIGHCLAYWFSLWDDHYDQVRVLDIQRADAERPGVDAASSVTA